MSAYICDADHVGFLGAYLARERSGSTDDTAAALAEALARENFRSIQCRYPDVTGPENWPGPTDYATVDAYFADVAAQARRLYWEIGILPPTETPHGPSPSGTVLTVDETTILPADILASVQCLEYQSCECPDFAASEGAKLIDAIRRHAIRRLSGYGLANWGFPGRSA